MSFVEAMASPILFLDRILDSAKRILESVTADLPHPSPHLVGPALLAHPDAGNRLWYIESVEEAIESCKENAVLCAITDALRSFLTSRAESI